MKDLLTVVLATAWVLEVIWLQRIRRHPYERPDHIDRDWRDLAGNMAARAYPDAHMTETYGNGR